MLGRARQTEKEDENVEPAAYDEFTANKYSGDEASGEADAIADDDMYTSELERLSAIKGY
jgi:hypothetical protein